MEKTNEKKDFLQKTWVVCALALVCTFLWGSASPCIKLGYALFKIPSSETWTQVLFAGTRFVFAGVLTILIGSILNRKMLLPTKSSVPSIVKLAIFQTILQYIFFYIGLAHNSGVKASIINGSNTFFVILVSTIIFRQEKLNLKKIIGCVIGFAGVIVVSMNGQKIDMNLSIMGDGSLFLCALSYAFSSCLMKNYSKKDNPVMLSGYQFIFGGIVMIILGLVMGGRITNVILSRMHISRSLLNMGNTVKAQPGIQSGNLWLHQPCIRCTSFSLVAWRRKQRAWNKCINSVSISVHRNLHS